MQYDVQQALDRKAEKWELQNAQHENQRLNDRLQVLSREIGEAKAKNSGYFEAISRLIDIISEREDFAGQYHELQNIKQYL